MNVLTLNPGSSSLRFQIVAVARAAAGTSAQRLGSGLLTHFGPSANTRTRIGESPPQIGTTAANDHVAALDWALSWCDVHDLGIDAVGLRVVHAGALRCEVARVDDGVLAELRQGSGLAPLHGVPSLALMARIAELREGRLPMVAVSDSAFHASLPEVARTYALPFELCERHGIRRAGFHGLALRSVIERLRAIEGRLPARVVAAHLGGGASVTAVRDGRSVDTSMGYSPLEGLVMGTRSGDVDPTLVALLARLEQCSAEQIVQLLNRESGLLGVSGSNGGMREIEALRAQGNARATLAFELFAHRARKYVAAMMAALGGADAIVFSGGIGENSAAVRSAILRDMDWCGVSLDEARNAAGEHDRRISSDRSAVAVHVIKADEESWIARATFEQLGA